MSGKHAGSAGFTLIEVLFAVAISTVLMLGLSAAMRVGTDASEDARARNALARDAHFAMERMVRAVRGAPRLMLPLIENPGTGQLESVGKLIDAGTAAGANRIE